MKILDLFSGIGGFSLGLERAGFETVAFCEIDKYCQEVLKKIWNKKIYNDVKEITKQKLKSDGIEFPEVITGGFPCQPFSIAGSRKGSNDSRYLWPEMFRIIKEFKPRWIIGENVRNIINIQDGMVFENVCTDLEGEGYEVRAFNIPAAGVGAPHKRERIWIVAHSKSERSQRSRGQESSKNINGFQQNKEEIQSEIWSESERRSRTFRDEDVENSRRTLRQGSELKGENENETRERYADQYQRPSSTSESDVADTYSQRQQEQCGTESVQKEGNESQRSSSQARHTGWESEPDVGRVAHGLSGRVHRLKALGNSIVPKIAEEIGRAIAIAEKKV